VRQGRFGPVVADWFIGQVKQRDDVSVDVIDLVDTPIPSADFASREFPRGVGRVRPAWGPTPARSGQRRSWDLAGSTGLVGICAPERQVNASLRRITRSRLGRQVKPFAASRSWMALPTGAGKPHNG
jgi:hypothetical protein